MRCSCLIEVVQPRRVFARTGTTSKFLGGHIVWNEPASGCTTQISAHCGNPDHQRCHFDLSAEESAFLSRSGQGRPLGALALWLALCDHGDRADHQAIKSWVCSRAALQDRIYWRDVLRWSADGFLIFSEKERLRRDDTESEPEEIPYNR